MTSGLWFRGEVDEDVWDQSHSMSWKLSSIVVTFNFLWWCHTHAHDFGLSWWVVRHRHSSLENLMDFMRRPWRLPCGPVQVPMVSITVPGKGCFQLSLLLGWRYLKWYDMIWNDMKWYEIIWTWYDMTWNDINDMIWNETSYTLQEIGDFWHFFNFGSSSRRRCSTAKAFGSHGGRCWDSALPEFGRLLSKQSAFFSVQNPGCSCFILAFSRMIINYNDQEL